VLDVFPLVGSVSDNRAFFDTLHRAFREEKWRSFGKVRSACAEFAHSCAGCSEVVHDQVVLWDPHLTTVGRALSR
jgi:hypothetical protein